jgi:hypothetical protein
VVEQGAVPESGSLLRSRSDLRPQVFPDIPAIRGLWQSFNGTGLSVLAGRTKKPRLEFWALKIELDPPARPGGTAAEGAEKPAVEAEAGENRRLRIFIGAGGEDGDGGENRGENNGGLHRFGYVSSIRVSSFVRDNGLLAGINTVPFDPSSAREGEERKAVGLGIAGGRLITPPVPRYDALVFYEDGGAAIVNQGEFTEPGNPANSGSLTNFAITAGSGEEMGRKVLHAAGGFHRILQNGELTVRAQRPKGPRYARSAAGLSAGGRTLYLIAINGGRIINRGATEAETALILKQLGALDVLNLDGGGSSALALRFPGTAAGAVGTAGAAGDSVAVLNTPVHAGIPGRERAVALCLGIREE